jgi:hypothetical protein
MQRITGAAMYNEAIACYDRIIENLSNISLLRERLPIHIAKLHAQTVQQSEYYIKHKLGIGSTTYSNNCPKPVYGAGQGSTDASARWRFISDALIKAYSKKANDAIIHGPTSNITTNNKISGFVDDTSTLLKRHHSIAVFLQLLLKLDAQLWERLLYSTGGKLEISKCNFSLFIC